MNVSEKIINLNRNYSDEDTEISDVLLTIITRFQLFEPCRYLSEDDEWLDIAIISTEDESICQPLTIKKSEITTFGIYNREEVELIAPQQESVDLYQ